MSTVGELLILIGGNNTALTAALAKSEAELKTFSATAGTTGATAGAGLAAVGLAGAAIGAGVGIFAALSTKAAAEFQAAMTLIQTQAGASEDEVRSMTAAVLQLSPAVGFGPTQLAEALYHLESSGFRGKAAIDALTLAAEGAKVGHADLEAVTSALVGALNSGVGGITNMSDAMGVMNSIVGAGDLRMQDLAAAMTTGVLSSANTFGVSMQSVGAALADMTRQHIPAEEAATRLRMTLSLLGAPSDKAAKDLATIGLSSTDLAKDMRSGGILEAVQDLKSHLDASGLSAEDSAALISHAFGGGRSSSAIMTLLNSVDKLGEIQAQVTAGTGTFGAAWEKTAAETSTAAARFGSTIDTIGTAIGGGFLPIVNDILAAVQPVIEGVATWTAANPELAATILAVVGGIALLVPVLLLVGGAIGVLLSPLGLIVAAVVGVGVAFATNFAGIRDIVQGVAGAIGGAITQFVNFVTSAGVVRGVTDAISAGLGILRGVFDAIVTVVSTVVGWITTFVTHLTGAKDVGGAAQVVFGGLSTAVKIVGDVFNTVVSAISTVVTSITSAITNTGALNVIFGILKGAADIITAALALLGDGLNRAFTLAGQVAGALSGALSTAFGAIKGVIDGVATVVGAFIDALKTALDLAGQVADAINKPHTGQENFDYHTTGKVPGFATGGVVPGPVGSPMLAVVHGGEEVRTPGQASGAAQSLTTHVHVHLDGREIAEIIDQRLFGAASVFGSGFVGNPSEP